MEIYSETRSENARPARRKQSALSSAAKALFTRGKKTPRAETAQEKRNAASEARLGGEGVAPRARPPLFSAFFRRASAAFRSPGVSKVSGKMNETIASARTLSARAKKIALAVATLALLGVCAAVFAGYRNSYRHVENAPLLSADEQARLDALLDEKYALWRSDVLKPLPYPVSPVDLDVWAESAILIDAANGCVLFEKNADALIPPASLAKMFVMYVVLKDVRAGIVSLDDVVSLPERSWAVNMPSDSSLMFLGQGQIVTLRELMLGLAVASGNDAAIAIARHISGGTDEFVRRMNEECAALGLANTRFVEPSGYDENNVTTARELAAFARVYVGRYPESISDFHSKRSIRYPLEKNLPSWQKSAGDSKAVFQRNTNPLLGEMDGVDGIKTGFIYESGYNLALTAQRNGTRFISVTMRGPGRGSRQGNEGRVHDGHEMMDFAFGAFADYDPKEHIGLSFPVAVPGGQEKFARLVPAWTNALSVPHIAGGEDAAADARSVRAVVTMPRSIYKETEIGAEYGKIQYVLGGTVLEEVPLVCDRSVQKGGLWKRFWGFWL